MEDRFSFIYRLKKIQYVSLSNFLWVGQMGSVWSFGCATWTLIALGEVTVVDLANFDLKFLAKFLCTRFVKIPIFAIMSSKCFWTSGKTSKNDLYNHFDIFFQKIQRGCNPANPPIPLCFTAITDHLMAGEVPPGWGPQSGVAPVNIPISFRSRAVQSPGGDRYSVGPGLCSS
jgi:hypothetical protein